MSKMLTLSPSAPVGPGGPSSPGLPCQDTKIKTFHVIITTFLYRRGRGGEGALELLTASPSFPSGPGSPRSPSSPWNVEKI